MALKDIVHLSSSKSKQIERGIVAFLVYDYFEQIELTQPRELLIDLGYTVHIISVNHQTVHGMNGVEQADEFSADLLLDAVDGSIYRAIVLPGGVFNADKLRMNPEAQQFVRDMFSSQKPIAAICHAPWVLISAGVIKGKQVTSYPSLHDDVNNAGGIWVDKPVVKTKNLITSRRPQDIEVFVETLHKLLESQAEDS